MWHEQIINKTNGTGNYVNSEIASPNRQVISKLFIETRTVYDVRGNVFRWHQAKRYMGACFLLSEEISCANSPSTNHITIMTCIMTCRIDTPEYDWPAVSL